MSLPAAAAPVAVLVLAWDETTPAVRALVEATEIAAPLFDSVVVLVPAGPPDAEEISQEEFLPLEVLPELPSASSLHPTLAAIPSLPAATSSAVATALLAPANTPTQAIAPTAVLLPAAAAATVATPPALPVPALSWSVVRVLRLSSFNLPELAGLASQALPQPIWRGDLTSPAAPYLGQSAAATEALKDDQKQGVYTQLTDYEELSYVPASSTLPAGPTTVEPLAPPAAQRALATAPPNYFASELPAPAIDAESDLAPVLFTSEENLPGATVAEEPLATEFAAARADWPEALASLREPASLAEPSRPGGPATEANSSAEGTTLADNAPTSPPGLRPAQGKFDAPNLNFQVIQYARFAVPVALAEAPFEAIYAPAWPTWLAAQELRQRTGRPLVLHVASLAAADGHTHIHQI